MNPNELISQVRGTPQTIEFNQVIDLIGKHYQYQATQFNNGDLVNEAGTNEGSCKIFYFAKLHKLSKIETLNLFGHYYRDDVLGHPTGQDHGNIRSFIKSGWPGITYDHAALIEK